MLAHCFAKPGARADNPWDHEYPVVKVGDAGMLFDFLGSSGVGVKCGSTREEADVWLLRYPDEDTVMPSIGRSGWNDLAFGGAIDAEELFDAVDDSYATVVSKLPKR